MYHISPLFVLGNVIPANIMYNLTSYHKIKDFVIDFVINDLIYNNNANNTDKIKFQQILCEQKIIINQLIELETNFKNLNNFNFIKINNFKTIKGF